MALVIVGNHMSGLGVWLGGQPSAPAAVSWYGGWSHPVADGGLLSALADVAPSGGAVVVPVSAAVVVAVGCQQ